MRNILKSKYMIGRYSYSARMSCIVVDPIYFTILCIFYPYIELGSVLLREIISLNVFLLNKICYS